jgi:dihydroorotase-like cyclic amidohydrolase
MRERIAEGMPADLLLVNGDSTVDIRATRATSSACENSVFNTHALPALVERARSNE